jgi:hypothetical protein
VVSANLVNPVLGGFAESVFGGIIAEMMDDVRAAQRAGLIAAEADPQTVADTLITSYMGATLYFATAPQSRPLLALLEPVVDANLAGIRRPVAADEPSAPRPRPAPKPAVPSKPTVRPKRAAQRR